MNFLVFLLLLISSIIPLWLEKIRHLISVFQTLLRLVLWPNTWPPRECSTVPQKNVYPAVFGWGVLCMSFSFSWVMLFKSSISLLTFWLVIVFIIESEILKSPTISPFNSVSLVSCILGLCFRCIYIFLMDWPFHQYIVFLFVIKYF